LPHHLVGRLLGLFDNLPGSVLYLVRHVTSRRLGSVDYVTGALLSCVGSGFNRACGLG